MAGKLFCSQKYKWIFVMINKTQDEITRYWKNTNQCTVSICCLAYNHEQFIQDALDGMLMQETDFSFEILIHDDASTDCTADIIRKYEALYPKIVKPIYQDTNQYSQGINVSLKYNYGRANGDYVAWCEGDDYWTDNKKLAKQIELMRLYPSCELSFHPAMRIDCNEEMPLEDKVIGKYDDKITIVSTHDVIVRTHDMLPTASCIITQAAKKEFVNFVKDRSYLKAGDIYMQFFGARHGGAIFINDVMSVYRLHTPHSWSKVRLNNDKKWAETHFAMIKSFYDLDEYTQYNYSNSFKTAILQRYFRLSGMCRNSMQSEYQQLYTNFISLIHQELHKINADSSRYILYGAGTGCEFLLTTLKKEKCIVIADRNEKLHHQVFHGIPVVPIEDIIDRKEKIIVTLIGRSKGAMEILTNNYNIDMERFISFDDVLMNAFAESEFTKIY